MIFIFELIIKNFFYRIILNQTSFNDVGQHLLNVQKQFKSRGKQSF